MIASLFKFPGLFSVFWPNSIMLSFGWSLLVFRFPILPSLLSLWGSFGLHQLQLVLWLLFYILQVFHSNLNRWFSLTSLSHQFSTNFQDSFKHQGRFKFLCSPVQPVSFSGWWPGCRPVDLFYSISTPVGLFNTEVKHFYVTVLVPSNLW